MNTQSILSRRMGGRCTAAIFTALFGIVPMSATSGQPAAQPSISRVADVPLADLDLATPEGIGVARERLQSMAQRICAAPDNSAPASSQPTFAACVDNTVANALRQIDAHRDTMTVHDSVTLATRVSLADLDLSTVEGSRAARERLEAMARRLCAELASRRLSYHPNYAACVHDAAAGALAQAKVLAAPKSARTVQRSEP